MEAVPGLGVENIVELRNYGSEESKGCPCPKNSLPQRLAIRRIITENCSVFGVICIPHRTRQQAYLSNEEKHPDTENYTGSREDIYFARIKPLNVYMGHGQIPAGNKEDNCPGP